MSSKEESTPTTPEKEQSGDIYSGQEESAYAEAMNALDEPEKTPGEIPPVSPSEPAPQEPPPSEGGGDMGGGYPPVENGSTAPPPFTESRNLKKYFILGGAVLFIIILIVLLIMLFRPKPAKIDENATITYWGLWEDDVIMQSLLDEYQTSHPTVKIEYLRQDPKQYRQRLQAALERGEGPDIYRFHNTWVPMFRSFLSAVPQTAYSTEEFTNTFYPVAATDLKRGEAFYGIPLEIDGLLLFYNEDILKSANVPVPVTWVDVQNAVQKLTVRQDKTIITSAIAMGRADNIEHFSDILALMMIQNGTRMDDSLFRCKDPKMTTCAVEALTFYHRFVEEPYLTWNETFDNSILAFAQGKVAMIIAPSWEAFTITSLNAKLKFKTAGVPQLPCERQPCPSINIASYWVEGVSVKSKYQEASWELLKYLSQKETMQKTYAEQVKVRTLFGEPYARVDLGQSLSDNAYIAPLVASAPTMKSNYAATRTTDEETGLNASLVQYLRDAVNSMSQGVSAETALQTADAGFKQVYSQYRVTPVK